ncbi:MAG: xanthine dehydrogenase family protein molybdopterin-binding subunit [Alicyclobacillus sp.]|nr:xanthine dehydrogenase family protein molybdopterin-binding subunit [Alicyclobacillus sp.]
MADIASRPQFTGSRVTRLEDARLVSGQGRYLDDVEFPGMLEVAFVRSNRPAAKILKIDVEAARKLPGVKAVWTHEDCPLGIKNAGFDCTQWVLAKDEVRYVGEPVVAIAAESRYVAEDAADLVQIQYEALPPVLDVRTALKESTRQVHEGKSNVFFHRERKTDGFDEAFAAAEHRLSETFIFHRQTGAAMENRAFAAVTDPFTGRLTCYCGHQSPHELRSELCEMLDLPENMVRVVVPEVGGAFGIKASMYPEYLVVAWMALKLRRPVKWISDRQESFLADVHARDGVHDVEVAFNSDGTIVALKDHMMADGGAYTAVPFCGAIGETVTAASVLTGPYKIPHQATVIDCTYSNKTPLGAYRGVWGPIASFIQEGVVDRVARYLKMDPAEVRRVNMLSDEDFPYRNPSKMVYDKGSYLQSMEDALRLIGYEDFRKRQAELRKQGRYIGIGISVFVEPTASASSEAGSVGYEACTVRVEPNGTVTAALGLGPTGQGHETTMAQLIADQLGVDVTDVVVLHGDTDSAPFGGGTGGSRSGTIGGGAAITAGREMRQKLIKLAAHALEASEEDIELCDGKAYVTGVPAKSMTIRELAQLAYTNVKGLPPGMQPGLEVVARYLPPFRVSFSNGTHIAAVEVHTDTGKIDVIDYAVVNDCGNLINPTIVEGQIHGGVAQGIGEAFLEELRYDRDGQLVTTSMQDYLLPASVEVPRMKIEHIQTPSAAEGGFKGMGEGSLIAAPAALIGAVSDALEPFGVMVNAMPVTPAQVLAWVDQAETSA